MTQHTKATLAELQARDIPRLDWRTILTVTGDLSDSEQTEMDKYFRDFVDGEDCLSCGRTLGGLFGSFTWTMVHGEGRCSNCDYPARALHYKVGPIARLQVILQYHPGVLRESQEATNEL